MKQHATARSASPFTSLPRLLTADDVAAVLRTTRTAVYAQIERGQIPGVVRLGRRVLVREADLLQFLDRNTCAHTGKV
ncbi:MAG TPA: helix-turn-helix domain-containing protein [Vicinamibacterales bacterium]|nr:helix-turn-helix domain-containing protein [Vicinamibacterales bacterium]